jgi:type III pantothenate kinase
MQILYNRGKLKIAEKGCNMLLAFDIGNSSVSIAIFELSKDTAPKLVSSFKITNKPYSADEYTLYISSILTQRGFNYNNYSSADSVRTIRHSVISSVVPNLTPIISEAAETICGHKPFIITSGIRTGFGIKIKNPEQLGADIVCNVAAALHRAQAPLAILDMGTATTITLVDYTKFIVGSVIMPGLAVSMNALADSAALLGDVPLERLDVLIGRNTEEAVNSGVINGTIYMIDGFIRNIRETYIDKNSSEKLSLIATGGLSNIIIPHTRNKFEFDENLTLFGAALLFQRNTKY